MNWIKKITKGLNKQKQEKETQKEEKRQKEYDEFITEYRKLTDKYKFDFKAEIVYTPDGIFPVWKVIDLTKVENANTGQQSKPTKGNQN
jgi:hypothetical protein